MSWDKNTINMSQIDNNIKMLDNLKIKYKLIKLGEVEGHGNNDTYWEITYEEEIKKYPIRKLEYGNKVIIEQMLRSKDCDMDDYLVSVEYDLVQYAKLPLWELERYIKENI